MVYYVKNRYQTGRKTEYNGVIYDSKFEAEYARDLDLRLKAKQIKSWERQVKIPLDIGKFHIANYYIDFVVYHNDDTIEYVETKGYAHEVWKMKWKIFEALYSEKPDVILTVVQQRSYFKKSDFKKLKK